jgi:transcription elongation factor GreA
MSEVHLSQAAYDRLRAELEDLTTRGRTEIARMIERARELGDLSENGDYQAAKDAQGKMEARIRQLQAMLERAVIVASPGDGSVGPGCVVTIRYEGEDEPERYLVGSIEERHDHEVISVNSPLGKALMGRRAGERVTYATPTGATLTVELVAVEPA